jgi:hypothetical protein
MKKILIFLLLLSGIAKAQLPGSTLINSRYEWLAGKFRQLKLPAYSDTASYPTWLPALAGDIMIDTSGADAGTVYARYGASAAWVKVTAGIAPSAIDNDNAGTGFNLLRPATQQIKRISLGVGLLGDSTTFANSNYFYVDTNLIYSYARSVAGSGSGGGGSGNTNSNVGSAYRFAIPNTNNIKTFAAGFGGSLDSATTNQLQYTVDSSVVQKKLAFTPPVIKNNNTISLQGAADGQNYVYGKGPTNQWGMQRVFLFDSTSGPSDSGEVHFNKTSKQFYVTPISAGGGGSSASMGKMNFTIGGVGAPAAGDSVLTSTYLISKDIDVFLNGDLVDSSGLTTTSSYTFDNTTGAITFKLAGGPGFVTGDHVEIRAWPTANVYTIPMPAVWSSFAYETRTGGTLTKVGNVYTASSSGNWNHTGLSSTPFTGDGRVRMIVPNLTTDIFAVLGLDATNAEQDYSTIDAGVVVYGSGDVKKNEGGAQTSVGTITAGQYLCLYRVGSVIKIQKSSDGNTWVDFPTPVILTFSSSATLYNVTSVYNSGVLNDPQIRLQ